MSKRFVDVTKDNWIECIKLTTNVDGNHILFENFVASNAVSLTQSKVEEGWDCKAVYDEDIMVGFIMYGYSHEYEFYELCRLMIDYRYQRIGYGMKALEFVISQMKLVEECSELFLSFDPENLIGKKLYEKYGFIDTGKILDDERLYSIKI